MDDSMRTPRLPRATERMRSLRLGGLAFAVLAVAIGCGKKDPARPAPVSLTPEEVVNAAVEAWAERDTAAYFVLLAPTGVYFSACVDGNTFYFDDVHDDAGERYIASRLFRWGTESLPPASRITITIDGPLFGGVDDDTSSLLNAPMSFEIVTPESTTIIHGEQFIFLVREAGTTEGRPDVGPWLIDGWGEIRSNDEFPPEMIRRMRVEARGRGPSASRVAGGSYCDTALAATWGRFKTAYLEGYSGPPVGPFLRP